MANLIDIVKKAASTAVKNKLSEIKTAVKTTATNNAALKNIQKQVLTNPIQTISKGLQVGAQMAAQDNAAKAQATKIEQATKAAYDQQKAAYDKQIAAIGTAPYSDVRRNQLISQVKKPVEPSYIRAPYSDEVGKAMRGPMLTPEQLKDVRYYESVQKAPLSVAQLQTYANGNTPTLNTSYLGRAAAAVRDTFKPLTNAAERLDTTTKFTNPALYQDNEINAFKQAQSASNAAGANAAWQTTKFVNPILRGMTVTAPAATNAVGAIAGDQARDIANPLINGFYKYNPKYLVGNLVTGGIQKASDLAANIATGKDTGVEGAIRGSGLSPEQQDIASTLYQAGTNIIGSKVQGKITSKSKEIRQQAQDNAESLRAGWDDFKRTGSLESAARAAEDHDMMVSKLRTPQNEVAGESDVLGFQKIQKPAGVVKERKVNVGKFADDAATQAGVKQQVKDLKLDTYVKKSFKEMEAEASQLSPDVKKLLQKSKTGLVSAEENLALTKLVGEQQKLLTLYRDSPNKEEVSGKIDVAQNLINHALDKQLKGGTAVGRALVSNRYLSNITTDPAYWLARAERTAGRQLNDAQRSQVDALARQAQLEPSGENKAALSKYVAELQQAPWWSNASGVYKAGLISSPKTIARNFVGNKALSTLETAKDIPAAIIDKGIGLLTGKRGVVASPRAVADKIASVPQGIKDAASVLTTGNSPLGLENTFEAQREIRLKNPILDKTVGNLARTAFRVAGAGDAPFKRSNYEYSITKQAVTQAANEGLKGKARNNRIEELRANPTVDMRQVATNDAKFATYQSDTPLIQKFNSAVGQNPITQALADIIVPFKQIPVNVFKTYAKDYSPIGGVAALLRARSQAKNGEFNQKQLSESLGRSVLGTGLLGAGAYLNSIGAAATSLPTDRNQLEMALEEGRQGHELNVPFTDWKVDASQLGVPGQAIALGADINDIRKKNGGLLNGDALGQVGVQALRTVADQPFLQGATRALDALKDPERSAGTFVRSAFSGIIPPFVNSLATLKDPEQRNAKTLADTLVARIPYLRDEVASRVGIWGEPRKSISAQTGVFSLFDPVNFHKTKDDPILNEMRRLNLDIGIPSDTLNGVKLTPKEYAIYQGTAGYNIKQVLETLMNSPVYQQIPDDQKPDAIDAVISTGRDVANEVTFSSAMRKRYGLPDASVLPDNVIVEATKMITSDKNFTDKTPLQRASAVGQGLKLAVEAFESVRKQAESDEVSRQMQQMNAAISQKEQEEQMQSLQDQLSDAQADSLLLSPDDY